MSSEQHGFELLIMTPDRLVFSRYGASADF